jgi:hypothetical protein
MVRPTGTQDALLSSNRFAPLNPQLQTRLTLPPSNSRWATRRSVSQESQARDNINPSKDSNLVTSFFSSQEGTKQIRDRTNSIKRKNTSGEQGNNKSARIDTGDCPHLKVINDNATSFAQILESLADYSGTDTVIADSIRALTVGVNSINDILGSLCAERFIPAEKNDSSPVTVTIPAAASGNNNGTNRRTLQQAPLGDSGTWSEVVGRNTKKNSANASKVRESQDILQTEQANGGNDQASNPFAKAVKEAERSLLIFNLDMGQQPIMNPATMSAKVTVGLLDKKADHEKKDRNNHTRESREFVDDILSQVVKMDFFGKKTGPCKIPGKPELNGCFYTIPVKLTFKDRSSAVAASDLLKQCMGIHTTTPYHKSLRAAMTQVMNKAREANPGYQAKVHIDLTGKSMKCFVRADTSPAGDWIPLGKNVPIPKEALDPTSRDYKGMEVPMSPRNVGMHKKTLPGLGDKNSGSSRRSERSSSSSSDTDAMDLGAGESSQQAQDKEDPFKPRSGKVVMRTPPPPKKNTSKVTDKNEKNGSIESQY